LRFLSCDIFLSLRTNTENASFQHNEHRWYQFKRCLEIQLITSLKLSLDAKLLSTLDLLWWLPFCFSYYVNA